MRAHFSQREIERACEQMRRTLRQGASGTPEDAAFVRAGEHLILGFIRFQLEEINRGGDGHLGSAVAGCMGWIIAQLVAGAPTLRERLELAGNFSAHVLMEAGDRLQNEGVVSATSERVGTA